MLETRDYEERAPPGGKRAHARSRGSGIETSAAGLFGAVFAVMSLVSSGPTHADETTRKQQIEALSTAYGFGVDRLDLIEDGPPMHLGGTLSQRLKALLEGYNYILFHAGQEHIGRVVITSRKKVALEPPAAVTIKTERQGEHHIVQATLVGLAEASIPVRLMLDTGASTLVLPMSMIPDLALGDEDLAETTVQTANGRVRAQLATLPSLELGATRIEDVLVAFLPDQELGGNRLLGMSVLNRFRLTIDDASNEITLEMR